jgi:hypothetical protein
MTITTPYAGVPQTNMRHLLANVDTLLNASPALGNVPIQKSFLSSAILASGPITAFTANGCDWLIEDVLFETDATGLAGGTNLQLSTDNARGKTGTLAAETVTNLGANKRVDATAASVTAGPARFTLEQGQHLKLQSTVAPCTGGGKLYVTVIGRPLAAGGTLT